MALPPPHNPIVEYVPAPPPPSWTQAQTTPPPGPWNDPTNAGALTNSPLQQQLTAQYPWITALGIDDKIRQWVTDPALTVDGLVADIRGTSQYKAALPGIFNSDGSMKMTESSYFSQQQQYRTIMESAGHGQTAYQPQDFAALFENDITPTDLQTRLTTYNQIVTGSQDVKDAFYVYTGKTPSNDDLYEAVVDPQKGQAMIDQYNQDVAKSPLDYNTWITRAATAGLDRVQSTLGQLQQQGVVTDAAIAQVRGIDPQFAVQMADMLYHGGSAQGPFLSLPELQNAFESAMIGGAATANGLNLPSQDTVQALRQAGVSRAAALQGFNTIATQGGTLQGMLERANRGSFTQDDFTKAVILNQGPQLGQLQQAQAQDSGRGAGGGGAAFQQARQGGHDQPGLAVLS